MTQHQEMKHGTFKVAFQVLTEARKCKIKALTASNVDCKGILVRGLTALRFLEGGKCNPKNILGVPAAQQAIDLSFSKTIR